VPGIPSDVAHVFTVAHDIAPAWHTRIQAAFQEFVDNAVSKTRQLPHDATVEDVASVYNLAYDLAARATIYRDGSRDAQVLRLARRTRRRKPAGCPTIISTRATAIGCLRQPPE